jgi:hypothetical protein
MSPDDDEPAVESVRRRWLRRLAPWVITGTVVTAILIKYPIGRIVEEMDRGNAWRMAPVALLATLVLWFTATAGDYALLRPQTSGLGFGRLMRGKAGVSVLNAVGLALNYGGFAVWMRRALGLRWMTAVGTMLMITVGDLTGVSVIAVAALAFGGDALPADMHDRLWLIAPIVAGAAAGLLFLPGSRARPRPGGRPIFAPWRTVPRLHRLASLLSRCGTISVLIISSWAASRAFGLPIPFEAWASFLPVLLVIGAMPINIGGFGPVQAAWLLLFSPWATGPEILAFQFLWQLALATALVIRGAPFLRGVVADVARKPPAAAQVDGGQPAGAPPST